jgi:hypothetical protein
LATRSPASARKRSSSILPVRTNRFTSWSLAGSRVRIGVPFRAVQDAAAAWRDLRMGGNWFLAGRGLSRVSSSQFGSTSPLSPALAEPGSLAPSAPGEPKISAEHAHDCIQVRKQCAHFGQIRTPQDIPRETAARPDRPELRPGCVTRWFQCTTSSKGRRLDLLIGRSGRSAG